MGQRTLEHGGGERCEWDGETWNKGWRMMWMGRKNLEHGVENDVDETGKP